MLCFEISVNGEYLCTAGVGDDGVLTAIVTWVGKRGESSNGAGITADLHVGGLAESTHLRWLDGLYKLQINDLVAVRVLERSTVDPPQAEEATQHSRSAGGDRGTAPFCSFCSRGQAADRKFVHGPTVAICSDCVATCNDILAHS